MELHEALYTLGVRDNTLSEQEKNKLLTVNKKLNQEAENRINNMRKSGL